MLSILLRVVPGWSRAHLKPLFVARHKGADGVLGVQKPGLFFSYSSCGTMSVASANARHRHVAATTRSEEGPRAPAVVPASAPHTG
jgi:hypothetical protein